MTYVEISLFSKSDRFIWGINQWMIWVLWPSSFSLEVIVTVKQCWNLLEGIPFFFEISTRQWIENPQLTRRLIIYFKVVPNLSRYNKKIYKKSINVLLPSAMFLHQRYFIRYHWQSQLDGMSRSLLVFECWIVYICLLFQIAHFV